MLDRACCGLEEKGLVLMRAKLGRNLLVCAGARDCLREPAVAVLGLEGGRYVLVRMARVNAYRYGRSKQLNFYASTRVARAF